MDRECKVGDVIRHPALKAIRRGESLDVSDLVDPAPHNPWIVVHTEMDGGSDSERDPWPDGHRVTVKLLNPNGTKLMGDAYCYSLRFYQSGCFSFLIKPEEIELVEEVELVDVGAKRQVVVG